MSPTIEIRTTQHVTIEYELAGLRERAVAWAIDSAIVGSGYYLFLLLIMTINPGMGNTWGVFIAVLFFLAYFLYHILFEIMRRGQSPGKIAMNIKVVRLDGKDPEWSDVTLRALLQLVDTIAHQNHCQSPAPGRYGRQYHAYKITKLVACVSPERYPKYFLPAKLYTSLSSSTQPQRTGYDLR